MTTEEVVVAHSETSVCLSSVQSLGGASCVRSCLWIASNVQMIPSLALCMQPVLNAGTLAFVW